MINWYGGELFNIRLALRFWLAGTPWPQHWSELLSDVTTVQFPGCHKVSMGMHVWVDACRKRVYLKQIVCVKRVSSCVSGAAVCALLADRDHLCQQALSVVCMCGFVRAEERVTGLWGKKCTERILTVFKLQAPASWTLVHLWCAPTTSDSNVFLDVGCSSMPICLTDKTLRVSYVFRLQANWISAFHVIQRLCNSKVAFD